MNKLTTTDALVREVRKRAIEHERILVAVAGPPGSGKSTLAENLAERLGPSAAVLPMDGFHLDNATLRQMDLFDRKGAPETFDASGFVALVRELRSNKDLFYPTFDREADSTVPRGGQIGKQTNVVVVEGNYLLLDNPPWSELADLFDLTVSIDVDRDVLETRLIKRWLDHGLSEADAEARALSNDMRNVEFVTNNSRASDFVIQPKDV